MRFETWIRMVMLSIATLGSGGVLAGGFSESRPALSATAVQAQPAKRIPVKRVKKDLRGDAGRKDATKVQAVPAVASTPALPDDRSALPLPAQQDEVLPVDNKVPPLALKGVRG